MDLETTAATARQLANELFRNETIPCSSFDACGKSCLMIEEERPLTSQERAKGWARRPFYAYDDNKLCNGCCSYWHAERAAQVLHEMNCHRVREAAQQRLAAATV